MDKMDMVFLLVNRKKHKPVYTGTIEQITYRTHRHHRINNLQNTDCWSLWIIWLTFFFSKLSFLCLFWYFLDKKLFVLITFVAALSLEKCLIRKSLQRQSRFFSGRGGKLPMRPGNQNMKFGVENKRKRNENVENKKNLL